VFIPGFRILFHLVHKLLQVGHDICQRNEKWQGYKADETWLTCCHVCGVAIAEHADRKALLPLEVTLVEELVEEQVGPFMYDGEIAPLLTYVASVKRDFKDELLVLEQLRIVCAIGKFVQILTILDVMVCKKPLEVCTIGNVLGHICCQDAADHSLSKDSELLLGELLCKVAVVVAEDPKDL